MDTENLRKYFNEYLDFNEKHFTEHKDGHEHHTKLLDNIQIRTDTLERKCEQLTEENVNLKNQLKEIQAIQNKMIVVESNVDKMQTSVDECRKWMDVITSLATQVIDLQKSRDDMSKEMEALQNKQEKLKLQLNAARLHAAPAQQPQPQHHQQHHSYHRTPVRSPSLYTMSNRYRQFHSRDDPYETNDDFSEISEIAECAMKEAQVLNDLHRSICSDD